MASVVIATRRSVTPHDVLPINLSRHRNVLADRQAQDVILMGKRKPVAVHELGHNDLDVQPKVHSHCRVGRDRNLLLQRELLPYLRVQDRLAL